MSGRQRGGTATIEFALSFVFLFTVLTGVFQFGYCYHVYNTLESAVRSAGRCASLRTYDSATSSPSSTFLTAVSNTAVYGNPGGTGQPVARGLAAANVVLTVTMERNVPVRMKIAITNYRIDAVFTTITLNGKPSATFPYLGRYAPPT